MFSNGPHSTFGTAHRAVARSCDLTSGTRRDPMGRDVRRRGPVTGVANQKVILAAMVPHASFGSFGIDSQEMWDAQIDIWLTEILFDAIVKTNQDKESIIESVIRRIDVIELMGGTGEPETKDAGSEGGGEMGMGMGMEMEMGMSSGRMGGRGQAAPTEISFPPEEEFGPAIEGGGEGMGMGMGMGMDMGMPGEGGDGPAGPKRYIAESEEVPYLERGFYLSVIIQQTKIADFIVNLANSDWPVQVRRFQVGANPYRVEEISDRGRFGGSDFGMDIPAMGGGRSFRGGGRLDGGRMGMDQKGPTLENRYAGNMPEFATGALNHPDLVQLDLCGVITIFKQPTEALEAVEARAAAKGEANELPSDEPIPETAIPTSPDDLPSEPDAVSPEATAPESEAPDTTGDVSSPAEQTNPEEPAESPSGTPVESM